jgi:hypothetical protein
VYCGVVEGELHQVGCPFTPSTIVKSRDRFYRIVSPNGPSSFLILAPNEESAEAQLGWMKRKKVFPKGAKVIPFQHEIDLGTGEIIHE